MPSRRILSNNNLAPVQEVAVNPYNSFNSDSVNKITRIVSGGKGNDVVVDGLDVSSNDKINWIDSGNLVSTIIEGQNNQFDPSCGWSGEGYYVGKFDGGPTVYTDLYIEHQNSYGFSWISCKLDDEWLQCYYGKDDGTGQSIERDFEVTFDLTFGTPKSIVAEINSSRAVLDHPESGRSYSLRLTRNFLRDTKQDGLIFRIGAVLDGADPLAGIIDHYDPEGHIQQTITNKTYVRICNIQVKVYGYTREPFSRSIGPANGVRGLSAIYGLAGIHPVKTLKVTPGLAIKDDVMLEELGLTRYDRDTVVELDPTEESSWIKGNPYTKNDFGTGTQYAFQLNNTVSGYTRHNAHFDSNGHLKVTISNTDYDLIDDYVISSYDRSFTFNSIGNGTNDSKFDEDNNLYLCHTGNDLVAGSICLLTYKGIVVEKKVVTQDDVNNHRFVITLRSDKVTAKLESLDDIRGFISFGPIKVSGDPQLYNSDLVKWAYVVIYYSYFKNPIPNVSYIGLVREEDLNDVKFRENYLILAKVRFVDFETIDIISYENRQRKWLPRSDKINYSTTCNFPEIWYDEVPDTVTDAIDYLAKFDVNLARLIRYKHDYDAEISSAFNLITDHEITSGSDKDKKPYISINDYSHLERRIRVNTNVLTVTSVYNGNTTLLNKEFTKTTRPDGKIIYVNNSIGWAITFEQQLIDNDQEYEYFSLGGEVLVKVSMGPYDSSTGTITNRYICFNTIGPFKFLEKDTGNEAIKADWQYSDVLLYPTSPSMNKSGGKFTDVDDGGWTTGYYGGTHTGTSNYLLSYTTIDGANVNEINNGRNHFHFIKFRNEILTIDRFLKLLDMLPRNPEVLFDKRTLEGQKSNNANDQVHIQSSQHQLDDNMVDYNLTMSVRDNVKPTAVDINGQTKTASTVTNHIKSSKFTITGADPADQSLPEKCEDKNNLQYGTFNKDLKDTALLTSFDISNNQDKSRIKIKSTDMHLAATGNDEILISNYNPSTKLFDIESSNYTIGDFFKYWFKPKFSYDLENKKLKIVIDGGKRYITRVSDIINEFNKKSEETVVSITSVQTTPNSIIYNYNGNSVKNGMLVYTDGEATSPYFCNTIFDDFNHFAKVESGSTSKVTVFSNEYSPINEIFDADDTDNNLYIKPVVSDAAQIWFKIDRIVRTDNVITIYIKNSDSNIDDFKVKEGMGIYTKNLNYDIYKYNNYTVSVIDDYIENDEVIGKILTVNIDSEYSGGSNSPVLSSNSKVYFINTEEIYGLSPNFKIDRIEEINNGTVKFHVKNNGTPETKYMDSVSINSEVYINVTNDPDSIYNISEDSPLKITSIDFYNETTSIEYISVSGYTGLTDTTDPISLDASGFVKQPVSNLTLDHSAMKLNFMATDQYKIDSHTFRVRIAKISTENDFASSLISDSNIVSSLYLDDVEYSENLEFGIQVSNEKYSFNNFTISNINNVKSEVYRNSESDPSLTSWINYTEFDISWEDEIDDSDLTEITTIENNVPVTRLYAYKYKLLKSGNESGATCQFAYKFKIKEVKDGKYIIDGTIPAQLNDNIVYTDDLGNPKSYTDEINVTNPQIAIVDENIPGQFSIERNNGYNKEFSQNELKAVARNITLKEIVSSDARDSKSRIDANVVIDISTIKDAEVKEISRDSYKTLERYFKSKLIVINDLVDQIDSETQLPIKPFITLSFYAADGDVKVEDINYSENPSKIIWKDEYRGYNNFKEEDEEFSKMVLYPVQVASNAQGAVGSLVNIVNEFTPSGSQASTLSGYGSYRGPIYTINAGVRSEFDFQYLKTPSRITTDENNKICITDDDDNVIDLDTIDLDTNIKLTDVLSLHDIPDIIFAKASMYYIANTESSGSGSNSINIGYNPNGGTINGKSTIQYKIVNNPQTGVTKYPAISNPVSNKRTFVGWTYNNERIIPETTTLKKNTSHTLIAEWNPDILYVTFKDTNSGSDKKPNKMLQMPFINESNQWNRLSQLADNGAIVGFPNWTRTGYSVVWSYDINGNSLASPSDTYNTNGYMPYVTKDENNKDVLTIYAIWSTSSITVTMNPNGGKWNDGTSTIITKGYNFGDIYGRLNRDLTKLGYEFTGWKNKRTGLMVSDSDNVGEVSHEITAQWKPKILVNTFFKNNTECTQSDPNAQLIEYDSTYGTSVFNDGRFGNIPSIYGTSWESGPLPTLSDFSLETYGYTFSGWSLKPDGSNSVLDTTQITIPFSHALFAKWDKIEYDEPEDTPQEDVPPTPGWIGDGSNHKVYSLFKGGFGSLKHIDSNFKHVSCDTYLVHNQTQIYTNASYPGEYFYSVKILPGRNLVGETLPSAYIYTHDPTWQYLNHRFEYWWLMTGTSNNGSLIQNKNNAQEDPIVPYYNNPVGRLKTDTYKSTYVYVNIRYLQDFARNNSHYTGFIFAPSYSDQDES